MKKSSGFTLIELLVVIAIIGILASIVLASLNTARAKGSDAATKSAMGQLRSQAEMLYDSASSYAGFCTATSSAPIFANIATNAGVAATCTVASDSASWAASVALKDGGTWCVDSTGKSAAVTQNGSACN